MYNIIKFYLRKLLGLNNIQIKRATMALDEMKKGNGGHFERRVLCEVGVRVYEKGLVVLNYEEIMADINKQMKLWLERIIGKYKSFSVTFKYNEKRKVYVACISLRNKIENSEDIYTDILIVMYKLKELLKDDAPIYSKAYVKEESLIEIFNNNGII